MNSKVFLHGAQYALGEISTDYTSIENLYSRAEEYRMPPNAQMWGWGGIRRTERGPADLAIESGSATLRAAGIAPASIDALVLCSSRFPERSEEHGTFVETIMSGIGLGDIAFYGQTLNRCVNLLAALDIAGVFVTSGRYRRVLVITADHVVDEAERMTNYALFSDGAASCVVSADAGDGGYQLVSRAIAQDTAALDLSHEISSDLARRANERLLAPLGMKLDEIAGLLHANIFLPLVVMKERQAGFAPEQLFTANITRIGHCFAADPLINLVDRAALGELRDDHFYLLASSVPGSRIGVLLRKLAP